MAFPSTPYVTASHTAVGPLTDPSPYVDLTLLGAEFLALIDTADGTKGRVFKEDGTRLAVVWLKSDGSLYGLRFKWSGTWSGVVPNPVRIYPPLAARASVAAGDTFGSFNAYDANWEMHLTLDEAVNNAVDGYKDQTVGAHHGQGVSMALPAVAGQVGLAQDFDGSADQIAVGADASLTFGDSSNDSPFTLSAWVFFVGTGGAGNSAPIISKYADNSPFDGEFELVLSSANKLIFQCIDDTVGNRIRVDSNATVSRNTWHLLQVTYDGSSTDGGITLYVDGSPFADTDKGSGGSYVAMHNRSLEVTIGSALKNSASVEGFIDGLIDEPQIHSVVRSADWNAEEFAATKNPGTYWDPWVFVPISPSFDDDVIELTVVMNREHALEVMMAQEQNLKVTMAQEQALTVVI